MPAVWRTIVLTIIVVTSPTLDAQVAEEGYVPPVTPWGHPDIQGVFNTATVTPFERPQEFAGREYLTAEEAIEFEQRMTSRNAEALPAAGDVGTYNDFWYSPGTKVVSTLRTSLVIDPPDGRIPPVKDSARAYVDELRDAMGVGGTDGPESRPLAERCLWWASRGPPIVPSNYNNNYRIAQSPEHVMIVSEMIHDARIIPLYERQSLPESVPQWFGDSRGRWEGNTLVVETTNFNDWSKTEFGRPPYRSVRGVGESSRVIERFTRISNEILMYEFTIDAPDTYEQSWTAQMSWRKTDGPIYEYACHEGNYALRNVLRGARETERAAEQAVE